MKRSTLLDDLAEASRTSRETGAWLQYARTYLAPVVPSPGLADQVIVSFPCAWSLKVPRKMGTDLF